MKESTRKIYLDIFERYPELINLEKSLNDCIVLLIESFSNGNKLMTCGNGGSASDAMHIVGELMKAFVLPRKISVKDKQAIKKISSNADYIAENLQSALPAISLVSEISLMTAYANDMAPDLDFAQQVFGYGNIGDVLFAISTSGNSKNVIYASEVAKSKGVKVIALTGKTGGKLSEIADILLNVNEIETYKIQELHLPVYHTICLALENEFFGV